MPRSLKKKPKPPISGRKKASPKMAVKRGQKRPSATGLVRPPRSAANAARITVIIPVFNQAALTRQCLETVWQTAGRDVAIVVVDDASTDDTPRLLSGYGDRLRVVTHQHNSGFARSCNDGAAAAAGDYLLFLNNDTIPQPGWLEALIRYAEAQANAAVVGSKLLYPNNTIQHAGVVICQDRYPRHIYTGFPADHPAANKSRRFQVVTAACMLVRRECFKQAGGFDTAFRNGFEDVDLCLRLGEQGHEIHYCADSVVHHLESVSPGRFKRDRENIGVYRERWIGRVQPDDLRYYLEDGLLRLSYEGRYPIGLEVSPELAIVDGAGRGAETERLLRKQSRQAAELLRENTRLRVELGSRAEDSTELRYEQLRQRIRETVQEIIPAGATVLVVSKGDGSLLDLPGRQGWHFPQTDRGAYAGHHPTDSDEAIAHLEALRAKGADYLLFPNTAFWWLAHYKEFKQHLESHYRVVRRQNQISLTFALRERVVKRRSQQLLQSEASDDGHLAAQTKAVSEPSVQMPKGRPKKKVLYVCHNHPIVMPGGAEVYALELYEAMRDSDEFEPIFLARAGATVINTHSRPGSRFAALKKDRNQHFIYTKTSDFDFFNLTSRNKDIYTKDLHEFLLTHQPDIVHFQHTHLLGYDLIRQTRNTLPGATIVYTLHEYLPICHRNGQMVRTNNEELCRESSPQRCHECFPDIPPETFSMRKRFIQSHFSLVDRFIAPSQFLLERYVEWGIPREKIQCEEYGRRGVSRLNASGEDRVRSRFGFFGQLNPFKGMNVLLKAMRILGADKTTSAEPGILEKSENQGPKASAHQSAPHLWIHGANLELQRGAFRDEFRVLLEAAKHNVTFVGPYAQSDLPRLMASIDWVVVPSTWWENSPLVIQEAFGHGRPVICSNIGAMAEKVTDGVNGLHFLSGNPDHLAETLKRGSTTPGLWQSLTAGIREVHSMQEHLNVLSRLYNEIVETKP